MSRFGRSVAAAVAVGLFVLQGLVGVPFASDHGLGLVPTASPRPMGHDSVSPFVLPVPGVGAEAPRAAPSVAAGPPPSSGRGTFFTNQLMPPALANQSCLNAYGSRYCVNITNDPSINYTSTGVLAVAYTAFVNAAPCGVATANTTTLIGFQRSTNLGATWSPPSYLGNSNCTVANQYPSALDPSLTSLGNGTLVLTFVEFDNRSSANFSYLQFPPSLEPQYTPYDRLVVQESYNGGLSWTSAQVLNTSVNPGAGSFTSPPGRPPYRDWVSATGETIYVAWENLTNPDFQYTLPDFSAQVHLRVSTDGGLTWGSELNLPVTTGRYGPSATFHYAVNPFVLAAPNGQVYVAYATGWADNYQTLTCAKYPPYACVSTFQANIEVANSSDNGTRWTVRAAASNVSTDYSYADRPSGIFHDPSPVLAYSPRTGQLFLAYSAEVVGDYCGVTPGAMCQPTSTWDIWVQNSSDGGVRWSAPGYLSSLVDPQNGTLNSAYQPALSVEPNGTLELVATYSDESKCAAITSSYYVCGAVNEVYLNSTDNGSTFSEPLSVSPNATILPDEYNGEYASMVTAGGRTVFAWSDPSCPTSGGCGFPFGVAGASTVDVSQPFTGTGVTLSFTETNLSTGVRWSASVLGNVRTGLAGTTLTVSGVPTGTQVAWDVPWVNLSTGVAYAPTVAPASPAVLTANTAVAAKFFEYVELDVRSVPAWPSFGTPQPADWNITPTLGVHWYPANTTQRLWANFTPPSCTATVYCNYANLTFLSWTGTGPTSVSTNATMITVKLTSGVIESANFRFDAQCTGGGTGFACTNLTGYSLAFVQTGLPAGVAWSVTIDGIATSTSSGSTVGFSVGTAPVTYIVWSVPAKGGKLWVPTEDVPSPVQVPVTSRVDVVYTLEGPSAAAFDLNLTEAGLPNGSTWSVDVAGVGYSVGPTGLDLSLVGGASDVVNGSFFYTTSGVGYYATNVSFERFVMNGTGVKTLNVPALVPINGSVALTVHYAPMYWLTMTATPGGSVTPASEWVPAGASVSLTARADPGSHFLTWTGVGQGATAGAADLSPNATIRLGGPVSEVAEFLRYPAPTWNITVIAGGLPVGTAFSMTLGTTTYDAFGSVVIGRLPTQVYPVSWPTVYLNSTNSTRFPVTQVGSTFADGPGGYLVDANGTFWVNYSVEYALSVSATTGGVTSPVPGVYWEPSGTDVVLGATPSYHYRLVGWNGTGAGSYSGPSAAPTVTVTAPVTESVQFVWRSFPAPSTFALVVTESGLPTATPWEVTAGTTGAAGASNALTIASLNGTYTLTVPPVYVGTGTRFVADTSNLSSVPVLANATATVTFTMEYLLTVDVAGGGTSSVSTEWLSPGAQVTLTATPQGGWRFESWNGSGSGGYTGTDATRSITVQGPVTESVSFAPVYSAPTSSSSTSGLPLDIGLLVAGLLVGVAAVVAIARRPPRPPRSSSPYEPGEDLGEPPAPDEVPPSEWSEEVPAEEHAYAPAAAPAYDTGDEETFDPDAYVLPTPSAPPEE